MQDSKRTAESWHQGPSISSLHAYVFCFGADHIHATKKPQRSNERRIAVEAANYRYNLERGKLEAESQHVKGKKPRTRQLFTS